MYKDYTDKYRTIQYTDNTRTTIANVSSWIELKTFTNTEYHRIISRLDALENK